MKLVLKDFQDDAVQQWLKRIRRAARDAAPDDLQSVSFTSPTGSGKTVMAAAAIEALISGDGDYAPDPEATFLWITDQPELNEQTRQRMLEASSVLGTANLQVIEATFDQETFTPGIVYFLNTQKLGKDTRLVTRGDRRTFTIWETISNTVRDRPRRFYVFIDEAHRGMTQSARDQREATTIIQKFIKGSENQIPPVPIVIGISATVERFDALVRGTNRTQHAYVVPPEEVRASGLLKETITLFHPEDAPDADMTMLRAAARAWQRYTTEWEAYCQQENEATVRPILVVQVKDGNDKTVSQTPIGEAKAAIEDAIKDTAGALGSDAFAHAFQEGTAVTVGNQTIRYLAPSAISADPDIKVVFFKSSLNTGWDCPQAEVMMSFRTANDHTAIAQLVGRMVRTPLARRVNTVEHLNSVALYLPHYDAAGLKRVTDFLTKGDPEILPPVDLVDGDEVVTLKRADGTEEMFTALEALPTYVVPRARRVNQVKRLMKFARLLANDGIVPDANTTAKDLLLLELKSQFKHWKTKSDFKKMLAREGKVRVRAVDWSVSGGTASEGETIELDLSTENIEDRFDDAGRILGEGIHKLWWRDRVEADPKAKTTAKLEVVALCAVAGVRARLEQQAQRQVQTWLNQYRATINTMDDGRRQAYNEIWQLASEPEAGTLSLPATLQAKVGKTAWPKHVYVEDGSAYHDDSFNTWETGVLNEQLPKGEVVGWLRNGVRKPWSLCVPYKKGGEWKPMYPDFLIVRQVHGGLCVDVLEPHDISRDDAVGKAAGLAEYAGRHADKLGGVALIIVDGDRVKPLDLMDEEVRDRVRGITTNEELRRLFDM